jgi:hypothetical protein
MRTLRSVAGVLLVLLVVLSFAPQVLLAAGDTAPAYNDSLPAPGAAALVSGLSVPAFSDSLPGPRPAELAPSYNDSLPQPRPTTQVSAASQAPFYSDTIWGLVPPTP